MTIRHNRVQMVLHQRIAQSSDSFAKSTVGNIGENTDVLGIKWNHKNDSLILNFEGIPESASTINPTKRNVVNASSRIYDPLGILSPITIQMKMLFQEICKRNLSWDDGLDEDLRQVWIKLVTELKEIDSFVIPRYYFYGIGDPVVSSCLERFCDASIRAYAAVVYLIKDNDVNWNLCNNYCIEGTCITY
jgi:hypothetical protein